MNIRLIVETSEFQRLKKVTLSGLSFLFEDATVFEHSIGVYEILTNVKASLEERIMGLLHDISRPAFGHIVDFAFEDYERQEFHEELMEIVLRNSSIQEILEKFGLSFDKMLRKFKRKEYRYLDSPMPNICADRLDYSLRHFKVFFGKDLFWILNFVKRNDILEFMSKDAALKYSLEYLRLSELYLTSHTPIFFVFSRIIKKALDKGTITIEDLLNKEEKELFLILSKKEENIIEKIKKVKVVFNEDYDLLLKTKVRYVDPLVNGRRLSKVDESFKEKLKAFLEKYKNGIKLKLL